MVSEMEWSRLQGREQSLASFVKGLTDVESGHGWTWVIEGEAGIGKSRLLREIGALARERGFGVLTGAGYELGHEHSYGAIAEALELRSASPDPLRASLAELLRRAPREGHHLEFRVLEDVLALVERLSMERPLVLVMDDLQWVDTASLLALAHVARHVTPLRAAIVVALRPPPRRQQADQFLESVAAVARWTSLDPLPGPAVDALLAELVGGVPGVRLRSQIERAGGNPLFVCELVAALRSAGSLVEVGGEVELTGRSLPAAINRLIDRHLRHLPAATGRALRMASVLGCDFSLADLADVMGQPASAIADLVQPALQSGLLGEQGSQMVFRHQLVRDAIYERMPQAMRSALHRDAGRLLAGRGAEVGQVAAHLALGGETARSEAIEWLRRAAREATSTSPALAIEHLDRAIHLAGPRHGERDELLADRVLALTWAGCAPEALQVAGDMLGVGVSSAVESRLRLGLARALLAQARWDESARQLELLAESSGMEELGRARLLGDAALALALSGSAERAAVHVEEARRIGERLQDDLTLSVVHSALAVLAHFEARHLDSVEASRQAVALAARSRSREAGTRPAAVWLGNGLKDADEFDEALTVLQVGRRRSEEAGMVWHLPLYDDGIGTVHFHAGDWDDALAEMETGIALAERTGTLWWLVTAKCMMAYIAIHRGQEQLAEASISTAMEHAGSRPSFSQNRLRWVRGLHHEARGEREAAMALLEEAWAATAAAGFLAHHLIIGPDLVRVALALGVRDRADEVARVVEEVAARTGVPSAVATGQRCRGLVDGDAATMERAVAALRQSPRRVELAFACEEAAVCLAQGGDRERATRLLDEALREYQRLGARRDQDRVYAVLQHALGVRRPRSSRTRRPDLGWQALTPTETRVADAAATGLTNREIGTRLFMSPRTVATHLSHIFGKLGISSRVELARLAALHRQG